MVKFRRSSPKSFHAQRLEIRSDMELLLLISLTIITSMASTICLIASIISTIITSFAVTITT